MGFLDEGGLNPQRWFISGVAGFIGSNLLETLLTLNQHVVGLDNFSTGSRKNLDDVSRNVTDAQWRRFDFIEGDLRSRETCLKYCQDVDCVLHQGALGSVPRSIEDPVASAENNIMGTINLLDACRKNNIRRFVYASSSSVYGDIEELPKREEHIGKPLSPYAVSKCVTELYAEQFTRHYGLETIGLRYFNVFGKRQDPAGPYAAVIPKWIYAMLQGKPVEINGTGETSRDFCYVKNVVQANIRAATVANPAAFSQVYNIAVSNRTSLNELYRILRQKLQTIADGLVSPEPIYRDFRLGDVMHSHADITKAQKLLGYTPEYRLEDGLEEVLPWYKGQ